MKRIVVLGGGESGVGAAILAKLKGCDVWLSDMGTIAPHYIEMLDKYIFPNSAVKSFFYASVQDTLQNVVKSPDSMASTIASSLSSMQENINRVYETFIDE